MGEVTARMCAGVSKAGSSCACDSARNATPTELDSDSGGNRQRDRGHLPHVASVRSATRRVGTISPPRAGPSIGGVTSPLGPPAAGTRLVCLPVQLTEDHGKWGEAGAGGGETHAIAPPASRH